jgi:AcrR family transcriptional regulator
VVRVRTRQSLNVGLETVKEKKVSAGRPRDVSADKAILRAAMDLFSEHGIEGASIGQIAKRAGVARTTIYRRWSSREDLIVHAIEHARNFPQELIEGLEKLPPSELVNLAVKFAMETLTRPHLRRLAARLIGASPSHPALLSIYQKEYLQPRRSIVRRILEMARVHGLLAPDADTEILGDMLSGAMIYRLLFQPEERSEKKVRAYLLKLFRQAGFRIPN